MPASAVRLRLAALLGAAVAAAACAARGFAPPIAPGAADAALADAYRASIARCAEGLRSPRKSGSSGEGGWPTGAREAPRGLTRDGGVRIEAVAPFGAPMFTLAGGASRRRALAPALAGDRPRHARRRSWRRSPGSAGAGRSLRDRHGVSGADDPAVKIERFRRTAWPAQPPTRRGRLVEPAVTPLRPIAVQREGALVEYRGFAGDQPQALRLAAAAAGRRRGARRSHADAAAGRAQPGARVRGVRARRAGRRQGAHGQRAPAGWRPALTPALTLDDVDGLGACEDQPAPRRARAAGRRLPRVDYGLPGDRPRRSAHRRRPRRAADASLSGRPGPKTTPTSCSAPSAPSRGAGAPGAPRTSSSPSTGRFRPGGLRRRQLGRDDRDAPAVRGVAGPAGAGAAGRCRAHARIRRAVLRHRGHRARPRPRPRFDAAPAAPVACVRNRPAAVRGPDRGGVRWVAESRARASSAPRPSSRRAPADGRPARSAAVRTISSRSSPCGIRRSPRPCAPSETAGARAGDAVRQRLGRVRAFHRRRWRPRRPRWLG